MTDYDCPSLGGAHVQKARRGWLRLVLLGPVVLSLLGLAGCGTVTYNCAPKGCFGGVVLTKANFGLAGTPWAVSSKLWVAPVTCDATCRASSGDVNNPGSISTFLLVSKGQYQIVLGYGTDTFGESQFFVDTYLPEFPYTRQWLSKTGVTQDADKYYVQMTLYANQDPCLASHTLWGFDLQFTSPYPIGIQETFGYVTGCTAFVPESFVLGEYLVGKSAGDSYTYFLYNQYSTTLLVDGRPRPTDFHYLTSDGTVSANAGPPYVRWTTLASKNPNGGTFYTECC
jgi:hypothetical protein